MACKFGQNTPWAAVLWRGPLKEYQGLGHMRRDCVYYGGIYPKRRKSWIILKVTETPWGIFHELANCKEPKIMEGHLMPDYTHVCISVLSKYLMPNVVGRIRKRVWYGELDGSRVGGKIITDKNSGYRGYLFWQWGWRIGANKWR